MCLIVVAIDRSAVYPLVLAANRDEQHARPTQPAAWWRDAPAVFGGRDLRGGGTWLAVDRRGRLAAVTNLRDAAAAPAPRSRGVLVADYLTGTAPAGAYAARIGREGTTFGAFNFLAYDSGELHYASNRAAPRPLAAGVHAFSNAPLGQHWPKVESASAGVAALLDRAEPLEPLFALLGWRGESDPAEQRYRTAHFVVGAQYGTRCSTVMLADAAGQITFCERSFDAAGRLVGEVRERFAVERD